MYVDKFKKFGGEQIPNVIEYLKELIINQPTLTITVGCDSIQRRRNTTYAVTIMIYNNDIRNGAHVIFFRESLPKIKNNIERLDKESIYAYNVAEFLHNELSEFYVRKDITERQLKLYKYHTLKKDGFPDIKDVDSYIDNIFLTQGDLTQEYKLVDIHLDYNPYEGKKDSRGYSKNRSNTSYKSQIPWIRSLGYRVFCKNIAYAASSAADLLLKY
jgi:predicted RNase H-related nuclease YkuK (DUF458 family)